MAVKGFMKLKALCLILALVLATAPIGWSQNYGDYAQGCYLQSAASTNATVCVTHPSVFMGVRAINTTATLYYLRMYNLAVAPTCSSATGFIETIPVPASASGAGVIAVTIPGIGYSTGIGFCLTGGGSSTDNTNAATGVYIAILTK